MACDFRLLTVLWLVSACLATTASETTAAPGDGGSTTKPPSPEPTTPGGGDGGSTTKPPSPEPTTPGGGDGGSTTKPPSPEPTTPGGGDGGSTTKPPSPEPTTPGGGDGGSTTKPPSPEPTTPGGGDGGSTTKPPSPEPTTPGGGDGGSTTKPPSPEPTTPGGGDGGSTTKPPSPEPTTPEGGDGGSTTKPPPPTTEAPNPCTPGTCGDGSTCIPLFNQNFECKCLAGDNYNKKTQSCDRAKVFPGQLSLPNVDGKNLDDQRSKEFSKVSSEVIKELQNALGSDSGYIRSTVLRFLVPGSTRFWSREENSVLADVENIYETTADITAAKIQKSVTEYIQKLPGGSELGGGTFTEGDLCEGNACDATTTTCTPAEGSFVCNCLAGYIKTTYAQRMCTACPSGEKASSDKCVPCSFGYSGFNCNESWKLVLVIVGSVFGGLLLLSVIGMIVMARRPAKKSSKKVKGENVNGFSTKAPLVSDSSANNRAAAVNGPANSFSNAGVPRIPRATTANSLDGRTNLEMTPSNSRQGFNPAAGRNPRLYDDPDDLKPYSQSRPQSSHYAQSRPQSNPYAQSRPQTNPYASNQGYANPYYKHDDGRRLY